MPPIVIFTGWAIRARLSVAWSAPSQCEPAQQTTNSASYGLDHSVDRDLPMRQKNCVRHMTTLISFTRADDMCQEQPKSRMADAFAD